MIIKTSDEFYSRMQRYGFVHPDDEDDLEPEITWCDIEDILTVGTPIDAFDGVELVLYAIAEPGEDIDLS